MVPEFITRRYVVGIFLDKYITTDAVWGLSHSYKHAVADGGIFQWRLAWE